MKMKAFQVAAILAVVLCAAYAQRVPLCSSLRRDFEDVLFRNGQRVRDACPIPCMLRDGRPRTFYTCCPGFTADVENGADEDGLVVVNAREVEVKCEPETAVRPTSTEAPPTTRATEAPPTTRATEAPQTASATIPQGDRDTCNGGGPERESQYISDSRDSLCQFTCETAVATNGVVFRTSTRTVHKCCSGEPIRIPSLNLYRCPEPTEPTEPPAPVAFTVQSTTEQRTATTAAPTRATTAAPTAPDPCRGPTFESQFTFSSRSSLCQFTCETPVAVNGITVRTNTRTVHTCCSGEPILIPSLRLYRCP